VTIVEVNVMGVSIDLRTAHAPLVQDVLTKYGCVIKTRLGLHETDENSCSEHGILLLQLKGSDEEIQNLQKELLAIDGVKVNSMKI
jgi:metal-responsive CopG/Arc/MetJ family transcriptional regulator